MKEHIKVKTIGTQYDPERVVCITEEARDILQDALYAEINELKSAIKTWEEHEHGGMMRFIQEKRKKIKIADRLLVQIDDTEVA